MDQNEYFRNLHEYVENLEEDIKAAPELYETRLGVCKECDLLADAMCRACGCYVEMRAAIEENACPYDKW